jgi:hypothetical protein
MSDTINLDSNEKLDILFKDYLNVTFTDENKRWYEEQLINYKSYIKDENILVDSIPKIPEWTYPIKAEDIGLTPNDFYNYKESDSFNILNVSILEDKTRTIRRYKKLKLDILNGTTIPGQSWIKKDSSNNNILEDTIQFNYNNYKNIHNEVIQPYQYFLYSNSHINDGDIILNDETGGNWIFNIKAGILFIPDYENFENFDNSIIPDRNKLNTNNNTPLLTYYKYIGRKGNSSNFNILQIVNKKFDNEIFNNDGSVTRIPQPDIEYIVNTIDYNIISEISLNVIAVKANSKYRVTLNFNYLSSNYIDTLLKVALCYRIYDNSFFPNEEIIGEYILGTENTTFNYQLFSNTFYESINCDLNSNIDFYLKAMILSTSNNQSIYDDLDDLHKPKIYFNRQGNSFSIEEINN